MALSLLYQTEIHVLHGVKTKQHDWSVLCSNWSYFRCTECSVHCGLRQLSSAPAPSIKKKKFPWSESASELYRPSDRRLSAKLVPTFADRGCHVVSVTNPYGCILGFLDRSLYFFFQVAPQLNSRG
jgi:hypothetical protein